MTANNLRDQISACRQYAKMRREPETFICRTSVVPLTRKVVGCKEFTIDGWASLDGWLTTGRFQ